MLLQFCVFFSYPDSSIPTLSKWYMLYYNTHNQCHAKAKISTEPITQNGKIKSNRTTSVILLHPTFPIMKMELTMQAVNLQIKLLSSSSSRFNISYHQNTGRIFLPRTIAFYMCHLLPPVSQMWWSKRSWKLKLQLRKRGTLPLPLLFYHIWGVWCHCCCHEKQARKSSEDTQVVGYARFEKFRAG